MRTALRRSAPTAFVEGFGRYGSRSMPALDGLRGCAALSVLAFHVFNTTAPDWASGQPAAVRWFASNLGQNGVSCFFVLSAFLLGMPFLRAAIGLGGRVDVHRYARARFLRLFPAWWIVLAVMAALWRPWVIGDPLALLQYAGLQQNYNPRLAQHVVPQAWTLGIEISFYVLLPFLIWTLALLVRRLEPRGRGAALILCFGGLLLASYVAEGDLVRSRTLLGLDRSDLRHSLVYYGDRFALGLLCATVFLEMRRRGTFVRYEIWLAAGIALFVGGVSIDSFHRQRYAAAAAACFVMTLAVGERAGIGRLFACSPMRLFGRLSYGIYLWHLPLKYFGARAGLFPGRTPWATLPCIVGLTAASTAFAYISYAVVERPALGLVDRPERIRRAVCRLTSWGRLWHAAEVPAAVISSHDGGNAPRREPLYAVPDAPGTIRTCDLFAGSERALRGCDDHESCQTSSRMMGVRVPPGSIPSTATSGPPIIVS
jgi:peptidoglycan/LPS O-acetylase OafA/YrhL